MLPPLSPSVLERNPRFKALYHDLSTSRLNPDATTRLIKQQRAQAELEKTLQAQRRKAAESTLLQHALEAVAAPSSDLPVELRELCQIASAHALGRLSAEASYLLSDDLDVLLHAHLDRSSAIPAAVSQQLQSTAALLSHLLLPAAATATTTTNRPQTSTPPLAAQAAALQSSAATLGATIAATRSRIAALTALLHAAHRELLEAAVRALEQVILGAAARGQRARAEHLAAVARGLELKAAILERGAADGAADGGGGSVVDALRRYEEGLGAVERGLRAREEEATRALEEYEAAGPGMMELARRFGEVKRACAEVEGEIKRLERREGQ